MSNSQVDVSAGAPNLENYAVNGDRTVTDNVTGLMWQQDVPTTTYSQMGASAYCLASTVGGYHDWRLPSLIELVSIVDFGLWATPPLINATAFPSTTADIFWASTAYVGTADGRYVSFQTGHVFHAAATSTYSVRCVR